MALRRELKETALSAPGAANGRTSQGFTNSIEILPNSSQQLCSCYKRRKSLKILNVWGLFETITRVELLLYSLQGYLTVFIHNIN